MSRPGLAAAAALAVASCAQTSDATANRTAWVTDGPPVNCISTNQIRTMRIIDDRTIDFEMTGRRTFRNDLPFRCPGLSLNRSVQHNSRTSQLCSLNTVSVNTPGTARSATSCRLGQFQPIKRAPAPERPPSP